MTSELFESRAVERRHVGDGGIGFDLPQFPHPRDNRADRIVLQNKLE